MKIFKDLLLIAMTSLLLLTTGCQSFYDMVGLGNGGDEAPIEIDEVDIVVDEDAPGPWSEPNEAVTSGNDWAPIAGVVLPSIYFSYDREVLGTSEKRKLDQVGNYLKTNNGVGLIIEGNCDERGGTEYNRSLGEKRALTVKSYLVSIGVSADKIQTISYGEEKPAVTGTGENVFAKNRRADLIAAKIK